MSKLPETLTHLIALEKDGSLADGLTAFLKDSAKVEWWQLLNWSQMKNTWEILPEEKKQQIRTHGFWSLGVEKFVSKT